MNLVFIIHLAYKIIQTFLECGINEIKKILKSINHIARILTSLKDKNLIMQETKLFYNIPRLNCGSGYIGYTSTLLKKSVFIIINRVLNHDRR